MRAALVATLALGCGGGGAAHAPSWRPTPGTTWQLQLSGTVDPTLPVAIYVVDLADTPDHVLAALRARNTRVICYFSAGTHEAYRDDVKALPAAVVGKTLPAWPDERWLDVRAEPVRALVRARLDLAVARRCDGVDPDNVDAHVNDSGFPLTAADQLAFSRFLASEAHKRGLAVGLKNDVDHAAQLVDAFDWALVEECAQYGECDKLEPFVAAGKPVFRVEYGESCPPPRRGFSTILKRLELDAPRVACP